MICRQSRWLVAVVVAAVVIVRPIHVVVALVAVAEDFLSPP